MFRVIREINGRPVLYGLSFFIILTAYLAGGFAAARLEEAARAYIAGHFFGGEDFVVIAAAILRERLLLMAGQAFFSLWTAGMPLSAGCGMILQISLSLPWAAVIKGMRQGIFIVLIMLPQSIIFLLAGTYSLAVGMGHFTCMLGELRIRKSAEDKLREGLPAIRKMLLADAVMLACVPLEVLCFMNII